VSGFKLSEPYVSEIDQVERLRQACRSQPFRSRKQGRSPDRPLIGMAVSGLGPFADPAALQQEGVGLALSFLRQCDPQGFSATLTALADGYRDHLVVVVSKRGGTPEPHIRPLEQARAALEARGGNWPSQALAVSMAGQLPWIAQAGKRTVAGPASTLFDWVGGPAPASTSGCRVEMLPGPL